MGKENDVMMEYLQDNQRFADLFNGSFFQGKEVVKPEELTEASEVYKEDYWKDGKPVTAENPEMVKVTVKPATTTRTRDVIKRLRSGGTLKVLAVENQELADYTMPWRGMNYDSLEYGRQIRVLKRRNKKQGKLHKDAEKMCGLSETDRLAPAFTICLYHGKDKWKGPKSLKEMMDFGEDGELWENFFKDYGIHMLCINELEDFSVYQSPLKELFAFLACREDKTKLKRLLQDNPAYSEIDEETAQVMNVFTGVNHMKAEKKVINEEVRYDMCKGLRDWAEEERENGMQNGMQKGIQKGIEALIETCCELGLSKEDVLSRIILKFDLETSYEKSSIN